MRSFALIIVVAATLGVPATAATGASATIESISATATRCDATADAGVTMAMSFVNQTSGPVRFDYTATQFAPIHQIVVAAGNTAPVSIVWPRDDMVVGVVASKAGEYFNYHTYLSCPGVDLGAAINYPASPDSAYAESVSFDRLRCDPQTGEATVGVTISGPEADTVGVDSYAWGVRTRQINDQALPFHGDFEFSYLSEEVTVVPLVDLPEGSAVRLTSHSYVLPTTCPPAGDHLTISAPQSITYGRSVRIGGQLLDAIHHQPIAGVSVRLFARRAGGVFKLVARSSTTKLGTASAVVTPRVRTDYQWRFRGNHDYAASRSGIRSVVVHRDG